MNGLLAFIEMKKKKWQPKKKLIFQLRQFQIKKKLLHLNENKQPVHMRYHLFLQYGWFLQNLGKDFIRTNIHTTVKLD